jgi:hypothetical protein
MDEMSITEDGLCDLIDLIVEKDLTCNRAREVINYFIAREKHLMAQRKHLATCYKESMETYGEN